MWIWSPNGILLLQIGQFTNRLYPVIRLHYEAVSGSNDDFVQTSQDAKSVIVKLCDAGPYVLP